MQSQIVIGHRFASDRQINAVIDSNILHSDTLAVRVGSLRAAWSYCWISRTSTSAAGIEESDQPSGGQPPRPVPGLTPEVLYPRRKRRCPNPRRLREKSPSRWAVIGAPACTAGTFLDKLSFFLVKLLIATPKARTALRKLRTRIEPRLVHL